MTTYAWFHAHLLLSNAALLSYCGRHAKDGAVVVCCATCHSQVGTNGDFEDATKDIASLVYLCKEDEGCLPDKDWETSSSTK